LYQETTLSICRDILKKVRMDTIFKEIYEMLDTWIIFGGSAFLDPWLPTHEPGIIEETANH